MLNDKDSFLTLLDELHIVHDTMAHEPFFTADARPRGDDTQWEFPVKNFFVYDKDYKFYLVTVHLDAPPVDFASLSKLRNARGRVSFANEDPLAEKLPVHPGSVSPFCVMHDAGRDVAVVLDERLQNASSISAHPLSNDHTTTISRKDLMKFYAHTGHSPMWLAIPEKIA